MQLTTSLAYFARSPVQMSVAQASTPVQFRQPNLVPHTSSPASSQDSFSLEELVEALALPGVQLLDVRQALEIAQKRVSCPSCVTCPVTLDDIAELKASAAQLLPRPTAPVLCFCGVGKRAAVAKRTLEEMGYSQVYNVGGVDAVLEALDHTPLQHASA